MSNERHDEIVDLSALDPFADGDSIDARASRIARDAMDARRHVLASRRSEQPSIVSTLLGWSIPTMLAAGLVLAVALSTVARTRSSRATVRQVSAADVMGIPPRLTDLLRSTSTPSLADLGAALGETNAP